VSVLVGVLSPLLLADDSESELELSIVVMSPVTDCVSAEWADSLRRDGF
jgi:hypothetical protein